LNRDSERIFPEVIGQNVTMLLNQMDSQPMNDQFRFDLQQSLKQLADLKFALDESSIVAVTDDRGKILYVNEKFCDLSIHVRNCLAKTIELLIRAIILKILLRIYGI
jgi:two-component system sensor histidine kinase NreB